MYKPKPCAPCTMPAPGTPLRALVLNASLKHTPEPSNTQELAELVLEHLRPHDVTADVVRRQGAGPVVACKPAAGPLHGEHAAAEWSVCAVVDERVRHGYRANFGRSATLSGPTNATNPRSATCRCTPRTSCADPATAFAAIACLGELGPGRVGRFPIARRAAAARDDESH